MAVAENNDAGSGAKTFKEARDPFRVDLLEDRTVNPSFQLVLRDRELMLNLNLKIVEAHRERGRQTQFRRVHVSSDRADAGDAAKVIEHFTRADVASMQD